MIRIQPAPEPADFDENVRQPGLSAIAEMVGEEQLKKRRGPKREKIVEQSEDIPSGKLKDYWTKALKDLIKAYGRVCAYTSCYIPKVVGTATVDHMIPKSRAQDLVYEWSNYRLACLRMNTRKGDHGDVLDPFEIQDGWFALELVGFQVIPGEMLDSLARERVKATIKRLDLNDDDCRELREEYAHEYWEAGRSFDYLRRRAPFVARELERQGRLNERDR